MRKTRKNKARRTVYLYNCIGGCGKQRVTFDYSRAQSKTCAKCQCLAPHPDQGVLL